MSRQLPMIALIDADPARRLRMESLAWALGVRGASLATVPHAESRRHGLVLLVGDGARAPVAAARAAFPAARIIAAGLTDDQREAVAAFRAGADDFVWLGAGDAELAAVLTGHLAACPPPEPVGDPGLIGISPEMTRLRAFIAKLAPSAATVLITGETGTGKDVAAVLIHRLSRRAKQPLVALNCAAIPDALIEGELFGYERGAFSGAHAAYPGKLKLADGGTLLLDEIGELGLAGQAKLLRAIETREAWRLGGRAPTHFDVRIIAVTNRDLAAEVRAGRFREDLFYRLAVSQLRLPPLRDRLEDVAGLTHHLLGRLARQANDPVLEIDAAALRALEGHAWPGNARELRNALEVAGISAVGGVIRAADLPPHIGSAAAGLRPVDERARLVAALAEAHGNRSLAAQSLNCSRMTLYRRMQRHGVAEAAGAPV